MENLRQIAAIALTLATFSAPVWTQSASAQPMAGGSMMSGDNYYTRMTGMQKTWFSWISNNLDAREVRRYKAQGFKDVDIRGAAHIAMATGLPLPYVLSQLKVTGTPLQLLANELGVPRMNLTAEIPGYGMTPAEISMATSGAPMPKM